MIEKCETSGQLRIPPSRGRKHILSSSIENVTTAVNEDRSQSPYGSVSVPVVSNALHMPYSSVRNILCRILPFYPYKSRLCIN
ncbi:uncharacterized protein TNCV_2501011 [Trichonephila clavipes]|nr:uncharacterized protein TNCV_2501011 [Trichonephila clavipes]